MYKVSKLAQAGRQLHESLMNKTGHPDDKPELDSYYRELFRRISKGHGAQQVGWRYCLTNGEIELLVDYIFSLEVKEADERKALIGVLAHTDNFAYIERLYTQWLDNWNDDGYKSIFNIICEDERLVRQFDEKYNVPAKDILESIANGSVEKLYTEYAGRDCDGSIGTYRDALESYGLKESSGLYEECMKRYMFICNGASYMEYGVEKVTTFLQALETEDKGLMIHNMLKVMDEYQLRTFVSLVPVFREVIGNKDTYTYQDIVATLPKKCQDRYLVMQNQYLIYNVLGDNDRAAFWMLYADKGTIRVNELTNTLFLEFPKFTVIEFGNAEAAYFFNNEYMREKILDNIRGIDNEEQLERWLYNNTEWSLDKDHADHWRKAHVGNWQTDMKSYMGHNLRK